MHQRSSTPLLALVAGGFLLNATAAIADISHSAAEALLAADRAYAAAAAKQWLPDSLATMLADDVVMPAPPGELLRGKERLLEAIAANPANIGARLEWAPLRVGVSADGLQGFTYGYATLRPAKGEPVPQKYLAYWQHTAAGWQVSAYKRTRRPAGPVADALRPAILPAAAITDAHAQAGLQARELAFSERAQKVGLGQAFEEFGHPEAINLGGPDNVELVSGNQEIAKLVGSGTPTDASPVSWSAEWAKVAGSADLGITFGFIRSNSPPKDGKAPPAIPFFTIWRRSAADAPWLYVAE